MQQLQTELLKGLAPGIHGQGPGSWDTCYLSLQVRSGTGMTARNHTWTSVKTHRRPHRHPLWKLSSLFLLPSRSPCEPALGVCVCKDTLHDKRRNEDKERSHTDSRALILSLPSQPSFLPVPLHPDAISTHGIEPLVIWEVE